MKLYFLNSRNEEVYVGEPTSRQEVGKMIDEFVLSKNPTYKIHYMRMWRTQENHIKFDVGSWSEFFILKDVPKELYGM